MKEENANVLYERGNVREMLEEIEVIGFGNSLSCDNKKEANPA